MASISAQASALIPASADRVYDVLGDYRQHHSMILPPECFIGLEVEEGGFGHGTEIIVRAKEFGKIRTYRMRVSEPEPGRVLMETDEAAGVVTTFRVEPRGDASEVTIQTEWRGLSSLVGRTVIPAGARMIFRKQLQRLARYMESLDSAKLR